MYCQIIGLQPLEITKTFGVLKTGSGQSKPSVQEEECLPPRKRNITTFQNPAESTVLGPAQPS
jgi:hypothetical protein